MHFPIFPEFRKISHRDYKEYAQYYSQLEPYSDFSFNNLLIWLNINDDLEISRHGNNLILRFSNVFDDNKKCYTLLGCDGALETADELFDYLEDSGEKMRLSMVPESALSNMLQRTKIPRNLLILADPASRDYIFNVGQAQAMEGGKYSKLRQYIHKFENEHASSIEVRSLNLKDIHIQQLILNHLNSWLHDEYFGRNDPRQNELRSIKRYFQVIGSAPAEAIGIFIKGTLVSVGIYHFPPQKDWVIYNHIKCNHQYKYLFDYTYFCSLKLFAKQGKKFVNFEQDLGITGLRIHKERLRPQRFLYRYEISRLRN